MRKLTVLLSLFCLLVTVQGANNYTDDPDIVCAYRHEADAAMDDDSSGNANHLTNDGVGNDTTWETEGSTCGRYLGGDPDKQTIAYASLPADLPGKANDQTWSVTGYFRRDTAAWVALTTMWDSGGNERSWFIGCFDDTGYKLKVLIGHTSGTATYTVTNSTVTSEDDMYFYAVVFDEGDVDTYLYNKTDSTDHGWESDDTTVVNAMSYDTGCDLCLGDYASSDSYDTLPMYGQIDEVIIWKRCLSQADVASVLAQTYTYTPPGGDAAQIINVQMSKAQ